MEGRNTETQQRTLYANLLVDTVRRHAMLPSDVLQKILRSERIHGMKQGRTRKVFFSHNPVNVLMSIGWFNVLNFVLLVITLYISLNGLPWWIGTKSLFSSLLLWGGQPMPKPEGVDVVFRLIPAKPDNLNHATDQSNLNGRPLAFGIVTGRQSGLSHCGVSEPPKLDVFDDGSMNLTYISAEAPDALYGVFVVPGVCNATAQQDCLEPKMYHLDQNGWEAGMELALRVHARTADDANQDMTRQIIHLHTAWPVFFAGYAAWVWFAITLAALLTLNATGFHRYAWTTTVCTMWLILLPSQVACQLGLIYDFWSGILVEEYREFEILRRLAYMSITFFYVLGWTFFPKFPDLWISLFALGNAILIPLFENEQLGSPVIRSAPFHLLLYSNLLLFGLRVRSTVLSKLELKGHRAKFAKAWESAISAIPGAVDELAKLEELVGLIEQSIPVGTVARQFNLKSRQATNSSSQSDFSFNRRIKTHLAQNTTQDSGGSQPGFAPTSTSTTNFGGTLWGMCFDLPRKHRALSDSLFEENQQIPEPHSILSAGINPCDRLIGKYGFETVLAASLKHGDFVLDTMHPIESMDQLWTQAMLLRGSLLTKVLSFAQQFNGLFQVRDEVGVFEKSENLWEFSGGVKGRLQMGGIKSVERGTLKVDSVYEGDVSRVLDVCREMIVFESIKDMTDCLHALSNDPELSVVRIKSSMTKAGLNPAVPMGLHLISVNLRIHNAQTKRLAVSGHVCEVLLMLRSSAELLTPEVKKDYARHRNIVSMFNLTIIPGSSLLYEGRRLATRIKDSMQRSAYTNSRTSSSVHPLMVPVGANVDPNEGVGGAVDFSHKPSVSIVIEEDNSRSTSSTDNKTSATHVQGDDGAAKGNPLAVQGVEGIEDVEQVQQPRRSFGDVMPSQNQNDPGWRTNFDVALTTDEVLKLEGICRIASLGLSQSLDKIQSGDRTVGAGKASIFSLALVADTFTIASSRLTQVLCILLGIFTVTYGCGTVSSQFWSQQSIGYSLATRVTYSHFRYTNLADRSGNARPAQTGVADFGVIHEKEGDCSRRDAASGIVEATAGKYGKIARTTREEGASMIVEFDEPVPFYGWYIKSAQGGANTSNFDIHAKASHDDEWTLVGRPAWKPHVSGYPVYDMHGLSYSMPKMHGITLFEPMVFPTSLRYETVSYIGYGAALLLFGIFSFLQLPFLSSAGMSFGFLSSIILEAVLAIEENNTWNGKAPMVLALGMGRSASLFIASLLGTNGYKFAELLLVHVSCVFSLATVIVCRSGPTPVGPMVTDGTQASMFCVLVWGIFGFFMVGRLVNIRLALKLVEQDKRVYDAVWNAHLNRDDELEATEHLARVIKVLGLDDHRSATLKAFSGSNSDLHQCNRKFRASGGKKGRKNSVGNVNATLRTASMESARDLEADSGVENMMLSLIHLTSVPGRVDIMSQVVSFDQLYIQALLVHDELKHKCKSWALQSGAYFPLKEPERKLSEGGTNQIVKKFVKWSEVVNDFETAKQIKWPVLKRSARAFEKLARVYKGNVSRVCDIARISLYFDKIEDITMVLGVIMTDSEIQLLRAKNNLKPDAIASATAGYRSVHLNLRLINAKTQMMGCEMHICEVQLVLRSIGEVRTSQSHVRYRQYRDLRAM